MSPLSQSNEEDTPIAEKTGDLNTVEGQENGFHSVAGNSQLVKAEASEESNDISMEVFSDEKPDDLITAEMKAEEEKLEAANAEEEKKLRQEVAARAKAEKQLQEKRYMRLMSLLNKSEFYSQFLLKQIEKQSAMKTEKKKPQSKNEDKENSSQESNSSGNSSQESPRRGQKRKSKGPSRSTKRCRDGKYNIEDVIDKNVVKAKVEAGPQSSQESDNTVTREDQPLLFENGTMRAYQLDGYSWLMSLYENGINGILGDEMGLGKTIQTIALICHLMEKGVPGPFLVIAPLSTLPNWMSEFERFAPKVPTILYHGADAFRAEKRRGIQQLVQIEGVPSNSCPVVITSYEVAIRDTKWLNRVFWRYICVDEGHRLKNNKCRLTKCLNTYPSSNRLLLTGTPLQNNLSELWSLLNFLMPEIFDSLDVFESWFDVTDMMTEGSDEKIIQLEKEKHVIATLRKILSPFFLRRMKVDVDLDIPPKKELLVYTPMTSMQLELYEATIKYDYNFFNKLKDQTEAQVEYDDNGRPKRKSRGTLDYSTFMEGDGGGTLEEFLEAIRNNTERKTAMKSMVQKSSVVKVKLTNRMMQCRKIVNHPYLIDYPLNSDGSFKVDEGLLKVSGKLQVLDQLLTELHKRGHRVLLFSQMTMMMDILEDYLTLRPKFIYKRLDGSTKLEDRQLEIKEFNEKKSKHFLFLLSTRAGGLGINLATADTVIIYDSDWNPQSDLQAQDRCHRIGQTRPVLILRFVTASTVDEHIVHRAATKRKLEKLIIQNGVFKDRVHSNRGLEKVMDEEELINLLNERDHSRIHRTETGHVFSRGELNQLLDRSDLIAANEKKQTGEQELKGVFKVIDVN